jgi:hypothetical protein
MSANRYILNENAEARGFVLDMWVLRYAHYKYAMQYAMQYASHNANKKIWFGSINHEISQKFWF